MNPTAQGGCRRFIQPGYWLLSTAAGVLWACPIVAISNTGELGQGHLVLGGVIGVFMGALILPWLRARRVTERPSMVVVLGAMTYLIALPLFLLIVDAQRPTPMLVQGGLSDWFIAWMRASVFVVLPQFSVVLMPLAMLTVYGLWRWCDLDQQRV